MRKRWQVAMALVRGLASTGWGVLRKSPQYTEPQLMYVLNRIIIPSHLISLMSQGCFELYIRWYENTICACVCICVWSYCCEYYHLFSNEIWFFFTKHACPEGCLAMTQSLILAPALGGWDRAGSCGYYETRLDTLVQKRALQVMGQMAQDYASVFLCYG